MTVSLKKDTAQEKLDDRWDDKMMGKEEMFLCALDKILVDMFSTVLVSTGGLY